MSETITTTTIEQQSPLTDSRKTNPRIRRNKYITAKIKSYINIGLILSIVLHLAMIIVAGINFRKCPVEPNIPLFLLIEGIIGIALKAVELFRRFINKFIKVSTISSILSVTEFILFIIGSYYVFKEYKPSYNPSSGDLYCNKGVYIFALVYISFFYAVFLLIISIIVCCLVGFCICEKLEDEDPENPPNENK